MINFDKKIEEERMFEDREEIVWLHEERNWNSFLWVVRIFSVKWWVSNGGDMKVWNGLVGNMRGSFFVCFVF